MVEPKLRKKLCKNQSPAACRRIVQAVDEELQHQDRLADCRVERNKGKALDSCNKKKVIPCPKRLNKSVVPLVPKGYKVEFRKNPNVSASANRKIINPKGRTLRTFADVRREKGDLDCLPTPLAAKKKLIQHSKPDEGKGTSRFVYRKNVPRSLFQSKKKKRPVEESLSESEDSTETDQDAEITQSDEAVLSEESVESEEKSTPSLESKSMPTFVKTPSETPQSTLRASFRSPSQTPSFQIPQPRAVMQAEANYQAWLTLARELLERLGKDVPTPNKVEEVAHAIGPFWQEPMPELKKAIQEDLKKAQDELKAVQRRYTLLSNDSLRKWMVEQLKIEL